MVRRFTMWGTISALMIALLLTITWIVCRGASGTTQSAGEVDGLRIEADGMTWLADQNLCINFTLRWSRRWPWSQPKFWDFGGSIVVFVCEFFDSNGALMDENRKIHALVNAAFRGQS